MPATKNLVQEFKDTFKGQILPSVKEVNLPSECKFKIEINSIAGIKIPTELADVSKVIENFWVTAVNYKINETAVKSLEFSLAFNAEYTRQQNWVDKILTGDVKVTFNRKLKDSSVNWYIDGRALLDYLHALTQTAVLSDKEVKPLF